jgi:hypothetical protein
MDKASLEQSAAFCREDADGLTVVGDHTICANGLNGGYRRGQPRQPVSREQVEVAKEFLSPCRRTRWARDLLSPMSADLKHWIENWAGRYISTGAAIVAALELELICIPLCKGSRNVWIGVHFEDVVARMAERGWYIARDHVGATRIKETEAAPEPNPAFWQKWAAENAIELNRSEPEEKPDLLEIIGCEPLDPNEPSPTFWEEIAEALGLSEAEEG